MIVTPYQMTINNTLSSEETEHKHATQLLRNQNATKSMKAYHPY